MQGSGADELSLPTAPPWQDAPALRATSQIGLTQDARTQSHRFLQEPSSQMLRVALYDIETLNVKVRRDLI